MRIDTDFGGIDASGFKKVSEGVHTFIVQEVKEGKDGALNFKMIVQEGSDEDGTTQFHRVNDDNEIGEKAAKRFFMALLKQDLPGSLAEAGVYSWDDFVGAEFEAQIVHNVDKKDPSKTYANIDVWSLPDYSDDES